MAGKSTTVIFSELNPLNQNLAEYPAAAARHESCETNADDKERSSAPRTTRIFSFQPHWPGWRATPADENGGDPEIESVCGRAKTEVPSGV